nr:hypothetical protein [Tanacetum cinerariifolium]
MCSGLRSSVSVVTSVGSCCSTPGDGIGGSLILLWTVLINSSLVVLTILILIEIIALETVLVVVLMSRLIKSWWTHLVTHTSSTAFRGAVGVMYAFISLRDFRIGSCVYPAYPRGMQQSAEDRKNLSEKKKEEEHLRLHSHRIDLGGSLSSHIRASPSNKNGKSNSLIVVLGTSRCLNVDVTLLKKRRWLCGSCLPVN